MKMSLCPVCGRIGCDHTLEERRQNLAEVERSISLEEYSAWLLGLPRIRIRVACNHRHDPVIGLRQEALDSSVVGT
jgi:hypothetical protein